MVESGFITEEQAAAALREKSPKRVVRDDEAPYFADWVLAQVRDYLGGIDTDIRVVTTSAPSLQRIATEDLDRSAKRRVGKQSVDPCSSRWTPNYQQKHP